MGILGSDLRPAKWPNVSVGHGFSIPKRRSLDPKVVEGLGPLASNGCKGGLVGFGCFWYPSCPVGGLRISFPFKVNHVAMEIHWASELPKRDACGG